jgi:hypothetical protein
VNARLLGLVWGVACGSPGAAPGDSGGEGRPWSDPAADDDWAALVDPGATPEPWTADDVVAAVDDALGGGLPDLAGFVRRYEALVAMGDEDCPGSAFNGGFEVASTCAARSGVRFSGVAGLDRIDESIPSGDSWTGVRRVRSGPADYAITDLDGHTLTAGGVVDHMASRAEFVLWVASIKGSFSDPGGAPWIARGFSGDLKMQVVERSPGDDQLEVDGGVTLGGASLRFTALRVEPRACADGVIGGTLEVRQASARWATMTFDAGCSPCGAVVGPDGEPLGDACIDVAPLIEAVGRVKEEP